MESQGLEAWARGQAVSIKGATALQVADWIEKYLRKIPRYTVERSTENGHHLVAAAANPDSLRMLIQPVPQRIVWHIFQRHDGVDVEVMVLCARLHRIAVISVAVLCLISFWFGWWHLILNSQSMMVISACSLLVAIFSMFAIWMLARGGGHEAALELSWSEIEQEGYALQPLRTADQTRVYTIFRLLVIFAIGAILAPGVGVAVLSGRLSLNGNGVLATLVGLLLALIAALLLMAKGIAKNRGMQMRFTIATTGLGTCVIACFLLAAQLGIWAIGYFDASDLDLVFVGRDLVATAPEGTAIAGPKGPVQREELAAAISAVRIVLMLMLIGIGLIALIGVYLGSRLLRHVDAVLAHCESLHYGAGRDVVRIAVSGHGFMPRFRALMLPIWILLGTWLWVGMLGITSLYLGAMSGANWFGAQNAINSTVRALELVLGTGPGAFWAEFAVRGGVAIWAAIALLAMIWSVGELGLRWRRIGDILRVSETWTGAAEAQDRVSGIVEYLCKTGGIQNVPLARVVDSEEILTQVCAVGLRRHRVVILATRGLLDAVSDAELSAVLAHELSHHVLGHCVRHDLVHLLARATCMGGVFAGAIEDSYGSELDADRVAVERFGINVGLLRGALAKLHLAAVVRRGAESAIRSASVMNVSGPAEVGGKMERSPRVRLGMRSWLRLYFADSGLAYWHPSMEDRIRAMRCKQ